MPKDWTGGTASVYKSIAATNHAQEGYEREENDFYATAPEAVELLLEVEPDLSNVWENACGMMHIADVLEKHGILGRASDIVNRTNDPRIEIVDFLAEPKGLLAKKEIWAGDCISNPPYKYALDFVKRSLEVIPEGRKVCMFLKLTFLEGKERKEFFLKNPPKTVYVCSGRIPCAKNGEFMIPKLDKKGNKILDAEGNPILEKVGSAVAYAWFVWEKGFKGDPIIKWIN
jgi:hypothetical protein